MPIQRANDISVRLPEGKKHLKDSLLKIAENNSMTFTQLMVVVIESFLALPEKKITIKLK